MKNSVRWSFRSENAAPVAWLVAIPLPTPLPGKDVYKRQAWRNRISDGRESEGNIVPIMTLQENAVYGKVPYFIHVCSCLLYTSAL